jgi:hypothetical protein
MQSNDIPLGLCQCGCGGKTPLVSRTQAKKGLVRGVPRRFIHGHQNRNVSPEWQVQDNGCWHWLHCVDYHGYGRFTAHGSGTQEQAHRAIYKRLRGTIPDGFGLDHVCHNADPSCPGGPCLHRRCVNPDHLEPTTTGVNVRRGKGFVGANTRKTACKYGHPFDEMNTYWHTGRSGLQHRGCRTCNREKATNLRERGRGHPAPFAR